MNDPQPDFANLGSRVDVMPPRPLGVISASSLGTSCAHGPDGEPQVSVEPMHHEAWFEENTQSTYNSVSDLLDARISMQFGQTANGTHNGFRCGLRSNRANPFKMLRYGFNRTKKQSAPKASYRAAKIKINRRPVRT